MPGNHSLTAAFIEIHPGKNAGKPERLRVCIDGIPDQGGITYGLH